MSHKIFLEKSSLKVFFMAGGKFKLGELEVTWINHATVKIKDDLVIYIDPWSEVMTGNEEKADLIISTHGHYDHFDAKAINQLTKDDTTVIIPPNVDTSAIKARDILTLKVGDRISVKGVKVTGFPAYNIDKPYHTRGSVVAPLIEYHGKTFYHSSDTDVIPEMKELQGKVDVAFLSVGGTYTMNQNEAIHAVEYIKPKVVIPIHFGVIRGTNANPEKFKHAIESRGLAKVHLL